MVKTVCQYCGHRMEAPSDTELYLAYKDHLGKCFINADRIKFCLWIDQTDSAISYLNSPMFSYWNGVKV